MYKLQGMPEPSLIICAHSIHRASGIIKFEENILLITKNYEKWARNGVDFNFNKSTKLLMVWYEKGIEIYI